MFTSDIDNTKRWLIRTLAFTSASAFCALFGGIYEVFSHGVYSYYMIYAFAFPLVLGTLPSLIFAMLSRPCKTSAAFDLYVFAIAAATVGSIVNGVLEIYGTSSRLMILFVITASVLLAVSVALSVFEHIKECRSKAETK